DEGRLNSTSVVVGSGRIWAFGGSSSLILDNNGTIAHDDRIPDTTPVHLDGMRFTLRGRDGEAVSETLGVVRAHHGASEVVVEGPSTEGSSTTLTIETLDRRPGSAISFGAPESGSSIVISQPPELDDGIIGGWATFGGDEFATYDNGVVTNYGAVHGYAMGLAGASASDNVMLNDSETLGGDTLINSLTTSPSRIDLNGHTLTIESGGLLSRGNLTEIAGAGQLTAGADAGAELLITGRVQIDSNIVDNPHGATGVTLSSSLNGSAHLTLSGENTYSGPTVVNGGSGGGATLEVIAASALPDGGDVVVNGGALRLNFTATAPLQLGRIDLLGGPSLRSSQGVDLQLQPESLLVESGFVEVGIVGDAPITKVSPRRATFTGALAAHSGPIMVEGGVLEADAIGPAPLDNDHAITVMRGGTLEPTDLVERLIRLDGGVVDMNRLGGFSAPIEILADGGVLRNGFGPLTSRVTGDGDLTIEASFPNGIEFEPDLSEFHGRLRLTGGGVHFSADTGYLGHIEIAAAQVSAARGAPFGTSQVTILPAGQLLVTDPLAADLRLAGGVLRMVNGSNPGSPALSGSLEVVDHSNLFIEPAWDGPTDRPEIRSDVVLHDMSSLIVGEEPNDSLGDEGAIFSLPFLISGNASIAGFATVKSFDNDIRFSGALSPGADDATLNLVGNDTFLLTTSVELIQDRTLSILEDGAPATVLLSQSDKVASGVGTLVANLELNRQGTLAPGASIGQFAVDGDVTFGDGGRFAWELAAAIGEAGTDWDLLEVEGQLAFDGTPDDPWVFEIQEIDVEALLSGGEWQVATAEAIVGFDGLAAAIDVQPLRTAYPNISADLFALRVDEGALVLTVENLAGDFDFNGQVDGADFLHWQRGESPTPLSDEDLADWSANFGRVVDGGSVNSHGVPEPNALLLAGIATLALLACGHAKTPPRNAGSLAHHERR
ncbi:MAG: hypothetical protein AAF961_02565, partial [Planctomycetota bacterium]